MISIWSSGRAARRGGIWGPNVGADQPVIEAAALRVARPDVRLAAAAHRVSAAIQAETAQLLSGAMAADAMLAENGLNIALEIDRAHWLKIGRERSRSRSQQCEHTQNHAPILTDQPRRSTDRSRDQPLRE